MSKRLFDVYGEPTTPTGPLELLVVLEMSDLDRAKKYAGETYLGRRVALVCATPRESYPPSKMHLLPHRVTRK